VKERAAKELPTLELPDRRAWEAWLEANHATSNGVWLRFAKKGSTLERVSRADALEVALCYGWIDGQAASADASSWLQRFTPRRPRSRWSRINVDAATQLIEAGLMKPAGLAQVEAARRDGRWERAYDSPRTMQVPGDLEAKLAASTEARLRFNALDAQSRYTILYRIQDAKRPETRARRIEKFVRMLVNGEPIR
jgi:uncharacterized protein YdeI (YjbR/CyaY-like superfamily)